MRFPTQQHTEESVEERSDGNSAIRAAQESIREQPPTTADERCRSNRDRRAPAADRRLLPGPVLAFFSSSVVWLLAGSVSGLLASLKMHHPWMLADTQWLTFGRIRPVHLNLVAYGWAAHGGGWHDDVADVPPVAHPLALSRAAGDLLPGMERRRRGGSLELLFGHSNGIEWLEFPTYAALIIFVAFGLNVVWTAITFGARKEPHVYVSQWYILGAIFWFPWLYATTNILLMATPTNGMAEAPITRRNPGLDQLVVRPQCLGRLVHADRAGGHLLSAAQGAGPTHSLLLSFDPRFLDVCPVLQLGRCPSPDQWPHAGVAGHRFGGGQHDDDHSCGHGGDQSSHDDARLLRCSAVQPDVALCDRRGDVLYVGQHPRVVHVACGRSTSRPTSPITRSPTRTWGSMHFSPW